MMKQNVSRSTALVTLAIMVTAQIAAAQDAAPVPAQSDIKRRVDWSSMRGTWGKRGDTGDPDTDIPEDKRAGWNKFQGSWGKRSSEMTDEDLQDAEEKRTNWNRFQGSWGKRNNWSSLQGSWGKRDISQELLDELEKRGGWSSLQGSWGKRAWKNLHGAWGKRNDLTEPGEEFSDEAEEVLQQAVLSPEFLARFIQGSPQKRAWSLWGKRPEYPNRVSPRSTNWSSLRGTWGKRSPDWSSLRGAWGKRGGNWSQFKGSWGKRDLDDENGLEQEA